MTAATRKAKTADTTPLLQKGDRITGKTAKGTQYTGSFEGYTTDEWIRCNTGHGLHTGEKTIALNPASVERVAEPATFAESYEAEGQAIAQSLNLQASDFVISLTPLPGCDANAIFKIGMIDDEGVWLQLVDDENASLDPVSWAQLRRATTAELAAAEVDTLTDWQPQEGDRVCGITLVGEQGKGIITQLGKKYAVLNNQASRSLVLTSLELLQPQAIPQDLLHLVGLEWSEQVDRVFEELGIANLGNFIGEAPDLTPFETWRGWEISFHKSKEVHLSKRDCEGYAWFISLGKAMSLKSNGDISKFCREAIDQVEEEIATVEAGMSGQESVNTLVELPNESEAVDSVNQAAVIAPNPAAQLSVLAVEILALYADAEQAEATMLNAGKAALSLYIALGEKLLAVKNQIGHGEWLPWLKARKIQERKAQRAIAVFKGFPQLAAKNDGVTDLTLTEALTQLSKKALKSAAPDQDGTQNSKLTPDAIEQQYELTGDHATPTLAELMLLYSQLGAVKSWRKGFAVERDDMGAPFPLAFRDRASAWKRWQEEWRSFAVEHPYPATEPPANALPVIPAKTEGLEGENRAYEYEPIDPRPVWFNPGGGVVEGQAIATNGRGMVRITWGEERESDVPRDRVQWSDPAITQVAAEIETGLAAMGIEVCQPSITPEEFNRAMWGEANPTLRPVQPNGLVEHRPACSRWEPEEVDHAARIQLQGLLKHLEPAELVKAAIVHSKCSLVDAAEILHSLANKEEFKQILEVFWRVKA